ncbi:PAP2 superfamily protein [Bacillus sp. THAF10]|uniref:phosphatase PAP2 family protein n=1 Tax=Bacillus sp. THAF10 TaxID=2587848 RepID=UPI0012691341|nr:phosphatase PAP2 family protein [Bacillus sp. THAF10]QFT88273.1 PAP2 superfamily protein [Bacillus sp. THAF10]
MKTEIKTGREKGMVNKNWSRIVLFTICSMFFVWSFTQIMKKSTIGYDSVIQDFVKGLGAESVVAFFKIFTMLGDKTGVIIVLVIALVLIWWKKRDYPAMGVLVAGVILVNEANKWLKDFTGRERPMTGPGAESLSFPSGHAMVGLFFYGLLLYLTLAYMTKGTFRIVVAVLGVLFIALLGTSRIFLNYHYPSDVLAGYAMGYTCLLLGLVVYEWLQMLLVKRETKDVSN